MYVTGLPSRIKEIIYGDGRHQNAPADGRRHAQMCVTEQLPDGRRQLEPETCILFGYASIFGEENISRYPRERLALNGPSVDLPAIR